MQFPLPSPDAAEQASSLTLTRRLADEITRAGGWMPFPRFMEVCLYTPGLGYYSGSATKLGSGLGDASDFVTAPELTPLFGRALAHPVAEICAASAPAILEFGAGSGRLACDLLRELERLDALPEQYAILDLSADLRARQKDLLERTVPHLASRVVWLDRLPDVIAGALIANEVLDAMPVHLIVWRGQQWHERGVALSDDGALRFADRMADAALQAGCVLHIGDCSHLSEGYVTEINLAAPAFVASLAERLTRGAMLLIDYGFPAAEFYHPQRDGGTLMTHYRHQAHTDPLLLPGLKDITAHVDFTAVARVATEQGLDLLGYTSQANFLINCGIVGLIEADPDNAAAWLPQANALQRLVSEAEMGELFKVIGLGRGIATPVTGFQRGDRSGAL